MTQVSDGATLSRWPWLLCLVAAAVMVGAMAAMGAVPDQQACGGHSPLSAILQFEWVRSPAEVAAFFGEDPCRSALSVAMDAVNRIDVMVYIPAFTAFQIFAAWALRANGRLLGILAINCALIAAGCDLLEDSQLFLLSWAARVGNPADPTIIDSLFWLVRTKFALLALNGVLIGWLIGRWPGPGWTVVRWLMIAGGVGGLAALAMPQWLAVGIGLAWLCLLGVATVRVVRPPLRTV